MATTINVLIGLAFLAVGCFITWLTYKYPTKNDYTATNVKGYIGGITFILLGIITLLGLIEW
jgi:hypothetical protein